MINNTFLADIKSLNLINFDIFLLVGLLQGVKIPLTVELEAKFGKGLFKKSIKIKFKTPSAGAYWLSFNGSWGPFIGGHCSLYFHPTKTHTAWTVGLLGRQNNKVKPCKWAISCQPRKLWGNKSGYNTDP